MGEDRNFPSFYAEVASTFIGDPRSTFRKVLRNYIAHDALPVAQSKQTLGAESCAITFTLPCAPLLRWNNWNRTTKAWIAGHGEAVDIVEIVNAYAGAVGAFDRWLFDRIELKYAADIDAFLREQRDFTLEVDQAFGA